MQTIYNDVRQKSLVGIIYYTNEVWYKRKGEKDSFYKEYPPDYLLLTKHEAINMLNFMEDPIETDDYLELDKWEDGDSYIQISW